MTPPAAVLQWKPLAEKYAAIRAPLNAAEILSIIWSESTGNPRAVNPGDPSWGLMQLTLPIAHVYGQVTDHNMLFDPNINVDIGSDFLAYLKKRYAKDFPITNQDCAWVSAYNQGEPNLLRRRPDPGYIASFVAHMQAFGAPLE